LKSFAGSIRIRATWRVILLGLMKTCSKLGVSFYAYLGDRLTRAGVVPELAGLVRQNATA
jgi:hypothetical protein